MPERVTSLPVHEFLEGLAAKQPTPGGGSAAALAGALGAGLVSMVCRYTVGRKRFADVEEAVQRVLARSEELRGELEVAVEDDVLAYGGYADAQAMPRETEDESRAREEALQTALRASTVVPLRVAERSAELLELAVEAAELGNPYLISDAAVGAELAAELNVRLNLGGVEDAEFVRGSRERLEETRARAVGRELVDRATRIVHERAPS